MARLPAAWAARQPAPPALPPPNLLPCLPAFPLPRRLRNDTGAFLRLLQAAAPAWLEDPSASLTLLAPTDLALQHSALSVAAFAGADQQGSSGAAGAGNASTAPAAPRGGGGANASAAGGQQQLSAGQLVGVYVLPRPFSLPTLAAMNGSLLETGATGWALRVHAGPPAVEGVSQRWARRLGPRSRSVRHRSRSPTPSCTLS